MCVPVPLAQEFTSGFSLIETVAGGGPLGPGETPRSLRAPGVSLSILSDQVMVCARVPRVRGLAHYW